MYWSAQLSVVYILFMIPVEHTVMICICGPNTCSPSIGGICVRVRKTVLASPNRSFTKTSNDITYPTAHAQHDIMMLRS
jgi:hypothetical protein